MTPVRNRVLIINLHVELLASNDWHSLTQVTNTSRRTRHQCRLARLGFSNSSQPLTRLATKYRVPLRGCQGQTTSRKDGGAKQQAKGTFRVLLRCCLPSASVPSLLPTVPCLPVTVTKWKNPRPPMMASLFLKNNWRLGGNHYKRNFRTFIRPTR